MFQQTTDNNRSWQDFLLTPPSFQCMSMLILSTEGGSKCSISSQSINQSIFSMGLKQAT